MHGGQKIDVIHRGRHNVAAAVAMRGHGSGDIDKVHESSTQQIVEWVGVVGEHNFGHLGNRFRNGARRKLFETFHVI